MKRFVLSIFVLSCLLAVSAQRSGLDLSGQWEFAIDPNGDLSCTSSFADKIDLPGSMPLRLKGYKPTVKTRWTGSLYDSSYFFNPYMEKYRQEENLKLPFFLTPDRHYIGDAWYRKTIKVPSGFEGKRLLLYLERPHITSTLYINTREVGSLNSLSVAHVYDVTDYIEVGKENVLCLRINNDADKVGVGADSHSVSDQTQGNWNGIVGRMELQAIPMTHIARIDVYPDEAGKRARIRMQIVRGEKPTETATGKRLAETASVHLELQQTNRERKRIDETFKIMGDTTLVEIADVDCKGFESWSEFTPRVIRVEATLKDGKKNTLDKYTTSFGLRDITTQGKDILVNGRPTQMRGTVENCCFPLTGYPPTGKKEWLELLRQCKRYGLNHMRFHSYCPPEAAFEAADELGFYLQPEGPSWPNHGIKLGNGMMIDQYLMQETERMVEAYGNHPSFAMLSSGNEPAGAWVKWVSRFVDTWRARDNRRIYTGASVGGGWAWQPRNQYHVKAGARGLDWDKRQPNTMDDFRGKIDTVSQPFVSHETGQWCAFPDLKETRLYKGVNKARNFEIFADILHDNGMEKMAEKFLMASGKLQVLCYKYELEKTLRTPHYAGYQLLGLNDYSGQGTALVGPLNVFWKEKGYVDPTMWREFCSPVTLLACLPRFTYYNDEEVPFELKVLNYGEGTIKEGKLSWQFEDEKGNVLSKQTRQVSDEMPVSGDVVSLSQFSTSFTLDTAKRLTLRARLDGKVNGHAVMTTNRWSIWVYPRHKQEEFDNIPALSHVVCCYGQLDDEAKEALSKGWSVLVFAGEKLTYGRDIVQQFTPVFWNTSWFKMRPPHTTGMYIDKEHPLFKHFPTEDFSDLQWWSLMNKQPVMLMDRLPKDFMPIVQPIDTWFLSRKLGMLFEAKVGKGKVMVTTMPLMKPGDPVSEQMLYALTKYMESKDFNPSQSVDIERIDELFVLPTPSVNMYTKDSPDELKKGVK